MLETGASYSNPNPDLMENHKTSRVLILETGHDVDANKEQNK